MITVEQIIYIVPVLALTASILYYAMNLRNTNITRQAQLFMSIYNTFSSKQYQKDREQLIYVWKFDDYDDFFRKYGVETNPEEHAIWDMYCGHLEGIAVLVRRGLIDSSLVYDLMYGSVIMFWEKYEPILMGMRERYGPRQWRDIEFLYKEIKRLKAEEEKQGPYQRWTYQ